MRNNSVRRRQAISTEKFEANYEKIFGSDAERLARIEAKNKAALPHGRERGRTRTRGGITIIPDIEPVKSPIDGTVLTTRSDLKDHNRRHGVTDNRAYSRAYMEKQRCSREQADDKGRHEAVTRAFRDQGYDC